jgi:phosphoribosylaminoimidazolecarboxamide formyltransferase/IMP cyclohydrolase
MKIDMKYGCNPHQKPAYLETTGGAPPLQILNGRPSYINILDALNGWQLVRELREATGLPSAASFKHVSPAGAAIARPLTGAFVRSQMLPDDDLSPAAVAYARARGADRMCSFGDAAMVSDPVDASLARLLAREVSDLVIAPAYEPDALKILKAKKNGGYLVLQIDSNYLPAEEIESRQIFGLTISQRRNDAVINRQTFQNVVAGGKTVPDDIIETLIVATIALKYTQSNSVCVAYDGQVIGMGAGQQSRIHCTRLACDKADKWFLQQHPGVLETAFKPGLKRVEKTNAIDQYLLWDQLSEPEEAAMLASFVAPPSRIDRAQRAEWIAQFAGVCLSSDAFFPFRDNIDRASRSHVRYVAQPGGSLRDDVVSQAAAGYDMTMIHTGLRCFLH